MGDMSGYLIMVFKTENVFINREDLSSSELDPNHSVANGLVVATSRLNQYQLLVRVDDGLPGTGPGDVHSRWILIQATLDGALGNDGYAAIALKVVAGQGNNTAGGQALCLFPQDSAASPTGREADAADETKLRHQIPFKKDLLRLASEITGKWKVY